MILIFFQNCLSPHQLPYIRECVNDSRVERVIFVMPRVDYSMRADMGWNNNELLNSDGIDFRLQPKDEDVFELLSISENAEDIVCLFSGIRADADVFSWLNLSLSYNVRRYIITEPPYTYGKPLWMHYLRFFIQDYKYVKHIDGVFAIGESCERYYNSISKRWKVFPFIYVTENNVSLSAQPNLGGKLKALYVGSLTKRKNVKVLVEAMRNLTQTTLTIVGDGEERTMLESLAKQINVDAHFVGVRPMGEVKNVMQNHDVLVLPSLHDGWGAVVNEALQTGMYVVCSDKCGAKDLLHSQERGEVFVSNDTEDLSAILMALSKDIYSIRNDRRCRMEWASTNISGSAIAKYFIDCLTASSSPICAWKQ